MLLLFCQCCLREVGCSCDGNVWGAKREDACEIRLAVKTGNCCWGQSRGNASWEEGAVTPGWQLRNKSLLTVKETCHCVLQTIKCIEGIHAYVL